MMLFSGDNNRWFFDVILYIVLIYFTNAITLVLMRFLLRISYLSVVHSRFPLTAGSKITGEIVAKILQRSNIVICHRRFRAGLWGNQIICFIGSHHGSIYVTGILDASISRRPSEILVAGNIRIDTNRTLFTGGTNKKLFWLVTVLILHFSSNMRRLINFITAQYLLTCIRKCISLSIPGTTVLVNI